MFFFDTHAVGFIIVQIAMQMTSIFALLVFLKEKEIALIENKNLLIHMSRVSTLLSRHFTFAMFQRKINFMN